VALPENRVRHAHTLPEKSRSFLDHVHHDSLRAAEPGEFDDREPDRTGAYDEDVFVRLRAGAMDRVAPDGERFDERELLEGQRAGTVELARGQDHPLAHATVAHDAKGLVTLTAIGMASAAGIAPLAVDVRLDSATVARFDVCQAFAHGEHLDAQFVARNSRVAEERHLAEITAVVLPAAADAPDTDLRLARTRRAGLGNVNGTERLGFFELDGF